MARLERVPQQAALPDIGTIYDEVKAKFGKLLEPVSIAANHAEIINQGFKRASKVGSARFGPRALAPKPA